MKLIVIQSIQEQPSHEEQVHIEPTIRNTQNIEKVIKLRKSSRKRRSIICSNCIIYLQESNFDVGPNDDSKSFL